MITVLGAKGFIGSALVEYLTQNNLEYYAPERHESFYNRDLGDVIYCIGLTSDAPNRPFETINAHVTTLSNFLQNSQYSSFTYISSSRLYLHNVESEVTEETPIVIQMLEENSIFNTSKLVGEAITLKSSKGKNRVVRLSNVYGNDFNSGNFLNSIIKDALQKNKIILNTALNSAKDYISLKDATRMLIDIALNGTERIYNIASGERISHFDIVQKIEEITGCTIEVNKKAETVIFPNINIDRIKNEFGFKPSSSLLHDLEDIINSYKANM